MKWVLDTIGIVTEEQALVTNENLPVSLEE